MEEEEEEEEECGGQNKNRGSFELLEPNTSNNYDTDEPRRHV
jgi:hypothetical protein